MFSTTPWFLEGKLFKKDSVKVIKTQKSHHKTKFLVTCNNPRIASTKTQSISAIKTSFAKDNIQKRRTFHDIKVEIFEFSWNKSLFQKLQTFENNPKVMKFHEKLSRKRWQVINFSPLFSKIRVKTFWNSSFSTDFYIWYLKLTSRFKTQTLK